MYCQTDLNVTQPPEETEFQQLVLQIGGKERIYLVSDPFKTSEDDDAGGLLREFVHDMFFGQHAGDGESLDNKNSNWHVHPPKSDFPNENNATRETDIDSKPSLQENKIPLSTRPKDLGLSAKPVGEEKTPQPPNGDVQMTKTSSINSCEIKRTIDSPIIIFIFRQEFVGVSSNEVYLKEILKDVRARTKRVHIRPALIGLIRSGVDSEETRESVGFLERALRKVFRKHAPEAIWVGNFIPKSEERMLNIKKNACRVLHSSQTSDNTESSGIYWQFQCLPWPFRGRNRAPVNTPSNGQKGIAEEGIPLKTDVLSSGPHKGCAGIGKDSH